MPVIKGEKYICNLWFRQFNKSKLYSETNSSYYENLPKTINEIKEPQIIINNSHVNLYKYYVKKIKFVNKIYF